MMFSKPFLFGDLVGTPQFGESETTVTYTNNSCSPLDVWTKSPSQRIIMIWTADEGFGLQNALSIGILNPCLNFCTHFMGLREKLGNLTFPKLQNQEFRFGPKKSNLKWGRNGCVKASSSALLELVPETKKENLEFELPMYDPSKGLVVDLAVVGGGPAGLAVAQQVSEAGLSVCSIDPSPKLIWPNNYGVWVDEFEAMDLLDCLDTTWSGAVVFIDDHSKKDLGRPYARVNRKLLKSKMMQKCILNGVKFHQAKVIKVIHEESKSLLICNDGVTIQAAVVLDATGFSRCLVQYDKPYNPGYQVAYGILAEVEEHPFDVDKMVFMDWRDSHLNNNMELKNRNSRIPTFLYAMPFSSNRIFLEETSLVARPGVPMEDIQERMVARLRHLGIKVKSIEEDERCIIPMGGPLQCSLKELLALVEQLEWSTLRLVWRDLWPIERRRQREFFCFGMDILLKLDLQGTRRREDGEVVLLNPAEKESKNCTQECQESPGATEMVVQEPLSHPSAHYVAILLLNFLFYIFKAPEYAGPPQLRMIYSGSRIRKHIRGSLRGPKKRQEQKEMSLPPLLGLKRIPAAVSSFPFQYVSKWCLWDHVLLWNLLVGQRVFFARGPTLEPQMEVDSPARTTFL
ncbi:Lycopene beta cyclase, chloroplastic/chromoplastic [Vitis vinifera]|uniref:lycopene beta-cyclase n=1 Tax=Vitis vinifera TaxID=29760 RepID=A0A438I6A6_VITVI|nr:Lycopene beta cyclase, chloroplastic/chromoplastic [Vitis vinifera]